MTQPARSTRIFMVFLILGTLGLTIPVWQAKVAPFADHINHLAEAYILMLRGQDPLLAGFYSIDWKLVPNLAMNLLVPPMAAVLGIYTAGKLFVVLCMLLLVGGACAVHHAVFGRLSLAPLAAMLFVYNGELDCGVMNYMLGVGVALWAFAVYVWLRERPLALRIAAGSAMVALVFCCHFHALAIYGMAVVSYELARWSGWKTSVAVAALAPFLLVPVLLALGPRELVETPIQWFVPRAKFVGLTRVFESQMRWRLPDLIAGLIMLGLAGFGLYRGLLRVHRVGVVLAAVATAAFLVVPHSIFSATDVDVRLPCGVIFFVLGLCTWHVSPRVFAGVLAVLLACRLEVVEQAWQMHIAWTDQLDASYAQIKPGSKVLVSQADLPGSQIATELMYMPCDAVINRSSLVSLMFADPRQQLIRVNEPFRTMAGGYNDDPIPLPDLLTPPADRPRVYWRNWRTDYDYLYVLSSHRDDPNPAADVLSKLYEGERFQLYAVRREQALR